MQMRLSPQKSSLVEKHFAELSILRGLLQTGSLRDSDRTRGRGRGERQGERQGEGASEKARKRVRQEEERKGW